MLVVCIVFEPIRKSGRVKDAVLNAEYLVPQAMGRVPQSGRVGWNTLEKPPVVLGRLQI
jgi:hypothetical protein